MAASGTTRGFSLVELMVSLAVMAFVASQILLAFSSQHRSYIQQEQVIETQQDVRMIADVIQSDLRMAGYMLEDGLAVGSVDGDTTSADILCVSDPAAIADSVAIDAVERLPGADVSSNLTGGNTTVSITAGELDIDGDGNDDFRVTNGGILITDGNKVHCARISGISGNDIAFTPPIPSGVSYSQFDTFAVPALVYEIVNGQLQRNGVVVSTLIEDLQVRFGIDDDEDGTVESTEFPVDVIGDTHNLGQLRTARVLLTSRSARPDSTVSERRTAAANRVAGSVDNFKRRRITLDVNLRNAR